MFSWRIFALERAPRIPSVERRADSILNHLLSRIPIPSKKILERRSKGPRDWGKMEVTEGEEAESALKWFPGSQRLLLLVRSRLAIRTPQESLKAWLNHSKPFTLPERFIQLQPRELVPTPSPTCKYAQPKDILGRRAKAMSLAGHTSFAQACATP